MGVNSNVDFARLVKDIDIREARGLTQERLARDLDVTFGTVNAWENGKHRPIPALAVRLLRIARETGINPRAPEARAAARAAAPRKDRTRGRR